MIQTLTPDFIHFDERGKLIQLCKEGFEQVNVLYSDAGTTRGEHYHKICQEAFFVINGSVIVTLCSGDETREQTFSSGDFFMIEPFVTHSLYFPEDCILIALYDKCVELENGEKDIYADH